MIALLLFLSACGRSELDVPHDSAADASGADASPGDGASPDAVGAKDSRADSSWIPCTSDEDCNLADGNDFTMKCDDGLCCRGHNVDGGCVCGSGPGCPNRYGCCSDLDTQVESCRPIFAPGQPCPGLPP